MIIMYHNQKRMSCFALRFDCTILTFSTLSRMNARKHLKSVIPHKFSNNMEEEGHENRILQ